MDKPYGTRSSGEQSAKLAAGTSPTSSADSNAPQIRDVVVLGGGIAGLTAASILSDSYDDVLLLEAGPQLGGSHRSLEANGYTFDIGSFFFFSDSIMFRRHPRLLETTVSASCELQRIRPDGALRPYPFAHNEMRELGISQLAAYILSLLKGRCVPGPDRTVEDICHRMLGRAFFEGSGLANYVERFYGPDLPASQMAPLFVDKRMQFVKKRTKLSSVLGSLKRDIFKGKQRAAAATEPEARVRTVEGFPAMYSVVAEDLAEKGVTISLNRAVLAIRKTADGFELETGAGSVLARQVVSTIPIALLDRLIGREGIGSLPSNPLLTLCVSFAGSRGFTGGVLFNFNDAGRWKRLTMHSDFYGKRQDREYFSVEIPVSDSYPLSGEEAFADFRRSVLSHGLFTGDLRLEEAVLNAFAYPRYQLGCEEALANELAAIEDFGILTVGRQGRFDYLPTSQTISAQVSKLLAPMVAR